MAGAQEPCRLIAQISSSPLCAHPSVCVGGVGAGAVSSYLPRPASGSRGPGRRPGTSATKFPEYGSTSDSSPVPHGAGWCQTRLPFTWSTGKTPLFPFPPTLSVWGGRVEDLLPFIPQTSQFERVSRCVGTWVQAREKPDTVPNGSTYQGYMTQSCPHSRL